MVIAVDDSAAAEAALDWAVDLVEHEYTAGHRVHTTLLTVHEAREFIGIEGYGLIGCANAVGEATTLLDELAEHAPGSAAFERVISGGEVTETILDEAHHQKADLIVVGTRGLGMVRQAMIGSVSQFVAAQRECPVAVVPSDAKPVHDRVLVGFDGSPGSRAAIRWAMENCAGDLHIVQAVSDPDDLPRSHEHLGALLLALGPDAAGRATAESVLGEPIEVLTDPSRAAPLIVVGARNDTPTKDGVWGSTAAKLVAVTVRPVVVVPPEPWTWGANNDDPETEFVDVRTSMGMEPALRQL
jgi:nucleotide-binding universal stress UspA family protein